MIIAALRLNLENYGLSFSSIVGGAQILLTLLAAVIAFLAHKYTRKTAKLNFIITSTQLLNKVNEISISTPLHAAALERLRPGVSGDIYKDYIALLNLNYLHSIWCMREEKVITTALANSKLVNGVGFLMGSSSEYAEGLLNRGFPANFRTEILKYYNKSIAVAKKADELNDVDRTVVAESTKNIIPTQVKS